MSTPLLSVVIPTVSERPWLFAEGLLVLEDQGDDESNRRAQQAALEVLRRQGLIPAEVAIEHVPLRSELRIHWSFVLEEPAVERFEAVHDGRRSVSWHLLFRDHLRGHPERAAEYSALKRELAGRFRDDRVAYTEAKANFVRTTLELAEG